MQDRITLGLTEKITLIGKNNKHKEVIARVDTGATGSSLDSAVAEELGLGPILKHKTIRSASGTKTRPVIHVTIEMHGKILEEEFTIIDRAHMKYTTLIGQDILKKERFLIDPLKKI